MHFLTKNNISNNYHQIKQLYASYEIHNQGRRRRSGRSGHGRTTFLAENGFGRTKIFKYSAEYVFLKWDGPIDIN